MEFLPKSCPIFKAYLDMSVSIIIGNCDEINNLDEEARFAFLERERGLNQLKDKGLKWHHLKENERTSEYTYEYGLRRFHRVTVKPLEGPKYIDPNVTEFGRFIVQLSSSIYQSIAENKSALDILTDFATIIGVTIPLAGIVLKALHFDKAHHKSEEIPSVTITIGEVSVSVTDEDLKDAEHAAMNLARKLIKEHPDAKLSTKVNVSGKLIDSIAQATLSIPPQPQQVSAQPRKKPRKKRSK